MTFDIGTPVGASPPPRFPRYERGPAFSGYRNSYARPLEIGIGTWAVPVRAPRVSDIPPDAPPFESAILPRRRYLSASTHRLFARLYLAS